LESGPRELWPPALPSIPDLGEKEDSLRSFARVIEKDLRVTDTGDGTLTVLILATAAEEPVKGSTGRSDDFCEAAVAALS
jgi:hypothetical protein